MTGFDLLLSTVASDSEIKSALASSSGVAPESIELLDDYPLSRPSPSVRVICIKSSADGDFPLRLSIDASAGDLLVHPQDIAQKLSQALCTSLLVDDGSPDPYKMKLIQPGNEPRVVELRATEADDGIFRLKDSPSPN